MATNTVKAKVIIYNKTASEFAKDTTTVFLKGQLLIENDTLKMKMGDGTNVYSALDYVNMTPDEVQSLITSASHTHSNKGVLDATTASFTTALKSKLDGVAAGAEVNVQSDWNETTTTSDAFIKNKPTSMPASDVSAWAKAPNKPTYTASEVGADPKGSANTALTSAKSYTDQKVSGLINGAPETADTLKELADLISENEDAVDLLNAAIGSKAEKTDLTAHTGNADIHVTVTQKTNWTSAYTHSTSAHAPSNAERNTIVGIQKNGADLTPDSSRKVNVTVPTKVSELTNDSGFKTTDNNTTYTLAANGVSQTNGSAAIRLTAGGSGSGNQDLKIKGAGIATVTTDASGVLVVTVNAPSNVSGNAGTATKLQTERTIAISGGATGTATAFDGSKNISIPVTSLNAMQLKVGAGDTLIIDGTV